MPITVTAARGTLRPGAEREVLPRLTSVLAEVTGVAGNQAIVDTIGGTLHLLDPADIYAGGRPTPLVMVELKLPEVVLTGLETRAAFIEAATREVAALTVDDHDPAHIWVNVLHAADGAWGVGGKSLTNAALEAAASD